jgi:hypothetical protein
MNNTRKLIVLALFTLLGMAVVAWLGYTYRNETVGFLRALLRFLFRH